MIGINGVMSEIVSAKLMVVEAMVLVEIGGGGAEVVGFVVAAAAMAARHSK